MNQPKSKLAAAFFESEDDPSLPSIRPEIDDTKLAQYSHGTVRKSKREKEKELAEAKRKEEEEHAAKAYSEFLEAFDGPSHKQSAFVKASAGSEGPASIYAPSERGRESREHSFSSARKDERASSPPHAPNKSKGKRAMDDFLEEIKREQADREYRLRKHSSGSGRSITALAASESQSGSRDRGDPETSNIFVANLPSNVSESMLGNFFSRHGPVGSVKIMWPRNDPSLGPGADMTSSRRNKSSGLSGFVSYMKRRDAEAAVREMDGYEWNGSVLRVGWSKAVPIAARAAYGSSSSRRSRSREDSGRGRERRSRSRSRGYRSRSTSRERRRRRHSRSRSRSPGRRSRSRSRVRRRSRSPERTDVETENFMRLVASMVKEHGSHFEETLRERENGKDKFVFLWDNKHYLHRKFRRLVDSESAPYVGFDDDGENSVYSTDSAEESELERGQKGSLGLLARRRFESLLRGLTGRRGEIARCMAFSLEHAECASEIADIITASLLVDSTAVPRKVARLYLICDILHNSAASIANAWKYRQEFQARLGLIFDHLSTIYHSFPGRITADIFKKQITTVVDVWDDWIVFPAEFTSQLRIRLEGPTAEEQTVADVAPEAATVVESYASRFKASSFKPAEDVEVTEDVDGAPLDDDVDGEVLKDDVDGVPLGDEGGAVEPEMDVDGDPLDDLDGDPLAD